MNTTYQHDWQGDRSLCVAVVTAIAAVTGDEPTTIEPLYESVDPDALARTFESVRRRRRRDGRFSATFSHHGCEVVISPDGEIRVGLDGDERD